MSHMSSVGLKRLKHHGKLMIMCVFMAVNVWMCLCVCVRARAFMGHIDHCPVFS